MSGLTAGVEGRFAGDEGRVTVVLGFLSFVCDGLTAVCLEGLVCEEGRAAVDLLLSFDFLVWADGAVLLACEDEEDDRR